MRRIPIILVILVLIINFSSCERDDICIDGDTPLLIVGFFDIDDTTEFKPVNSLRIISLNNNTIFSSSTFTDQSTVSDSIFIPLQIDASSTEYTFIIDSDGDETASEESETGNMDDLLFSYIVGEQFVSRACGFVANYNDLSIAPTFDDDNFIQRVTIVDTNITNNPTTINVKIFH